MYSTQPFCEEELQWMCPWLWAVATSTAVHRHEPTEFANCRFWIGDGCSELRGGRGLGQPAGTGGGSGCAAPTAQGLLPPSALPAQPRAASPGAWARHSALPFAKQTFATQMSLHFSPVAFAVQIILPECSFSFN